MQFDSPRQGQLDYASRLFPVNVFVKLWVQQRNDGCQKPAQRSILLAFTEKNSPPEIRLTVWPVLEL